MTKPTFSKRYTDENVTRLVALQVILLMLLALLSHWAVVAAILAVDFVLRAFTYLPSPTAFVAKQIVRMAKITPKPIFAPP